MKLKMEMKYSSENKENKENKKISDRGGLEQRWAKMGKDGQVTN